MPNQGRLPQDYTDRPPDADPFRRRWDSFPVTPGTARRGPVESRQERCARVTPGHRGHPRVVPSRAKEAARRVSTVPPSAPAPLVVPADTIVPGRARGRGPLRREGPAKLTGEAKYADDLVFPGAWYGATIRSSDAHARLLGFERDEGFDWTKVVFVTAADIPGDNIVSLISDDQPVLVTVGGEIQHHAEPLALVAAPDRQTLRAARAAVTPRTEALPPVLDPLVSDHVFAHYEIASGDLDAGFADAEVVLEGTYSVGHQEQLYIENNAMIAVPEEHGGLTVYGSLQCPYYIHKAMKRALALDDVRTRVVQAETGGGFGGKEEYPSIIAIHAALLARACRKPVRMIYDRHEDISATTKRHPAVVTHRTGMRRDGTLVAQDIEVVMDGGAYCTLSPVVLSRGALHAGGPYRCPNVRIRWRVIRTNTPPNGAFRGFGAPQTEFAAESQLDRLCRGGGAESARDPPPERVVLGDATRPGRCCATAWRARRCSSAGGGAPNSSEAGRTTVGRWAPVRGALPDRAGTPRAWGRIALAWHGAGFTG